MKKTEPLPIDASGNGARIRTIEFDAADAFMIAHGMMIASNTALMSGNQNAMGRLDHYRDMFLAEAPAAARLMRRDTDLCEIAIAMASAPAWEASHRCQHPWSYSARSVIKIGDSEWSTRDDTDDETHAAIVAMMEEIAPVSCIRTIDPDQEDDR